MMQAVNDEGKFKIQANGSLHIIGVHRSDAGMYTCIADNGVGSSALKQIQFEVKGRMNTKQILFMYYSLEHFVEFNVSWIHSLTNAIMSFD